MSLINLNAPPVRIPATTSSARVALPNKSNTIEVANESAETIYVKSGDSTVVATVNDRGIGAGHDASFSINPEHTHVAAITASGTGTVAFYIGPGE